MVRFGILFTPLAAALAACSPAEEIGEDIGEAVTDTVSVEAAAAAEPNAAMARSATASAQSSQSGRVEMKNAEGSDETGKREFSYAWPREVAAIPELQSELVRKRDEELAQQKQWWADAVRDCPPDARTCRSNTFELEWQVVADTPPYLSLSNSLYTYTGGAHGNYGRAALVWDREKKRSMDPADMFASPLALDEAIGTRACKMLNAEREKRRGEPVPEGAKEWPNQCVAMEETVIFLGSASGTHFDRIGVYYGPYVAGSYAEGDFEFTLPVTQAVIAAVKPDYRGAFAAK